MHIFVFFFQAEDGIRDLVRSRGLGDVYKRQVYCCFESKLSRILQEQGRQQLNKPWGKPKTEQCLSLIHI